MKRAIPAVLMVAAVMSCAAAVAAAQEPVKSFDQLSMRLKPGDTVWITDAQGREIKGRIRQLEPAALTLDGVPTPVEADAVRLITERTGRPISKGALLGLAAGVIVGVMAAAIDSCNECGDEGAWMLVAGGLFGAVGAGAGALVGALVPGKTLVVYRAPAPQATGAARVSIAPVIAPGAKGLAVSLRF